MALLSQFFTARSVHRADFEALRGENVTGSILIVNFLFISTPHMPQCIMQCIMPDYVLPSTPCQFHYPLQGSISVSNAGIRPFALPSCLSQGMTLPTRPPSTCYINVSKRYHFSQAMNCKFEWN